MQNYLDLLRDVMENGFDKDDRTGVGSRAVWGRTLRWDLADGFPIITTRKVAFRIAFEETMFFLRGETDTKKLEEKRIYIWQGNTTREFLDSRGLAHLPEGDIGTGYSYQWRNFGGSVAATGVDQVANLVEGIRKDPYGRRHIITAWNPLEVDGTPLPPCHILQQYQVTPDGRLNSSFVMRSNDIVYGLPYNIMGYAFLNMAFSKLLGYKPGELVYVGMDAHIYKNQFGIVEEQLKREPHPLPTLTITKEINALDDLFALQYNDVLLENYVADPDFKNKPPMAV